MTEFSDVNLPLHIEQLWIYPVKSCAGVRLPSAQLFDAGLAWDRHWMVVDDSMEFVSQRDLPRMALIQPHLRMHLGQLELSAPGMISLHLGFESEGKVCRVRVWDDEVDAIDMGDAAAEWFSEFLGGVQRLRLVRFDPKVRRLSAPQWTGGQDATNRFSDGFPVLVLSSAALAELNERLALLGHAPVDVRRFRPNVVLGGLASHDEDRIAEIRLACAGHPAGVPGDAVVLRLVKPCSRCSIPDVDPDSAASASVIAPLLQTYRQDRRLMGAATFGMNAIVRQGVGATLHEGMAGEGIWNAWDD